MSQIPNKEDVITKARVFLEAVAREVQAKLGANPKVVQQSVWWSTANPKNSSVVVQSSGASSLLQSGGHEREVFDWFRVSILYQTHLMHNGFPEQNKLKKEIADAGIQAQWVPYGFLLPLVAAWCKLPDPFDLTQPSAQGLLDEFAEVVTSGISHTKYRDVIIPIDIGGTTIELEESVRIRTIEEEELWELGSEWTMPTPPFSLQLSPSDNWCMLEIGLRHRHDEAAQIGTRLYALREAVVANLAIAVEGGFTLLPIGMTAKFGPNATGRTMYGSPMPRQFGSFPWKVTVTIDPTARQQLREMWPRVKEIMLSQSHYLSLPLRRLIDGLARTRFDDRIVDYAIGLEALLLKDSEQNELSYRFRLRGAMVLGEAGEDKHQAFQNLEDFYKARSTIVHGGSVSRLNLRSLADNGERLLRKVWTWHLAQGLTRQGAIARIDRRILGTE